MKKLIALLLALMMIFALAACNEDSPDPDIKRSLLLGQFCYVHPFKVI